MESLIANPFGTKEQPAGTPAGGPSMEVAHVLFMDIVGYSKLRMNQQAAAQIELQNLVNSSPEVTQAKSERKFICRPTGDGMALLFFRDIVSPVRTALQIHDLMAKGSKNIIGRVGAPIQMRMGIHSGTVLMVEDLNSQSDAAGDGINIAQRVMDCGDADSILLSSKVAESLLSADPWQRYLTDLGDVRVKHGMMIHLYNLYGRLDGPYYGNSGAPKRVRDDQDAQADEIKKYKGTFFENHPGAKKWLAFFIVVGALGSGGTYAYLKIPGVHDYVTTTITKLKNPGYGGGGGTSGKPPPRSTSGGGRTHSRDSDSSDGSTHQRSFSGGGGYDVNAPKTVVVPDLTGKSLEDAQSVASDDGLKVVKSDKSGYSAQQGEGLIYEQSPTSGSTKRSGTTIYVRVSKGDPPEPGATPSPSSDE